MKEELIIMYVYLNENRFNPDIRENKELLKTIPIYQENKDLIDNFILVDAKLTEELRAVTTIKSYIDNERRRSIVHAIENTEGAIQKFREKNRVNINLFDTLFVKLQHLLEFQVHYISRKTENIAEINSFDDLC